MFKNTRLLQVGKQLKRTKVTLPELRWDFNELEPFISGQINEIHYRKHHQTYVNGLNESLGKIHDLNNEIQKHPTPQLSRQIVELQQNIKFHGGGYVNHCLFWNNLTPAKQGGGEVMKDSNLYKQLVKQYGDVDNFIKIFNKELLGVQGSGWVFLVKDNRTQGSEGDSVHQTLSVVKRMNQDTVTNGLIPLLAIDAWEHAYYLQYQNKKADYFEAIWNVVNWEEVSKRYDANDLLI